MIETSVLKKDSPPIHYPCGQTFPITQIFGVNREKYAKYSMIGHDGVDLGLMPGNDLYSVAEGEVTLTQTKRTGYGRLVIVQHDGYRSYSGHNSEFKVSVGDIVQAGSVTGLSGGHPSDPFSGNSTGPHVHFEIRPDGVSSGNGYGGAVDPFQYLLNRYYKPAMFVGTVTAFIGLNVRSKPTVIGSKVLHKLQKRAIVDIWYVKDGWARLRAVRDEWVSATFLNVTMIEERDGYEAPVDPITPDIPITTPVDYTLYDAAINDVLKTVAKLKGGA